MTPSVVSTRSQPAGGVERGGIVGEAEGAGMRWRADGNSARSGAPRGD